MTTTQKSTDGRLEGDPQLRLVIPSFNRACQLECLLRSIRDLCLHPGQLDIVVFHRYTTPAFEEGYAIVGREFPEVKFVEQSLDRSFKEQFLGLMNDATYWGMIVDDMVLVDGFSTTDRPFDLLAAREDLFSLSLRLDGAKTFSQPINEGAKPPKHDADLVWRWKPSLPRQYRWARFVEKAIRKAAFYDWAFPCPMDGTVYRTSTARTLIESMDDFRNIPFMEASLSRTLSRRPDWPPNMIRYPRAKSVSLAMNSVDEHHDYPSLGLDPQQFNDRFLRGERLDYRPFQRVIFHACHVVTEPFWLGELA